MIQQVATKIRLRSCCNRLVKIVYHNVTHQLRAPAPALNKTPRTKPLWRGAGAGGLLAGTRRRPAAEDGVPPSQMQPQTHILLARSPAPYSPFYRRAHSPTERHCQVRWRARLPPPHVLLPHTYTQDGWFLQPQRRPARLPRRTIFSHCICRCNRMRARLPLNTYSSSTHRFPDERNPIEATPLSATSAELCSALGLELELGSHSSSHVPSHAPLLLATLLSHNIPFPRDH